MPLPAVVDAQEEEEEDEEEEGSVEEAGEELGEGAEAFLAGLDLKQMARCVVVLCSPSPSAS